MESVSEENPKTETNIPEVGDKESTNIPEAGDKELTSDSDSISEYMPPAVRRQYLKEMVKAMPAAVQNRLVVLKNLQLEQLEIEAKFSNELYNLEKSYQVKHQLLYDKRTEIINGMDEEEEPPKSNESEAKIIDGEGDQVPEPVKETKSIPEDTKGIPGFWLTVFRNSAVLCQLIQPQDEAALQKLTDVVIKYNDVYSYILEFHFDTNEFFSNSILTKQYFVKSAVDPEDPFVYDGPEVYKCIGCTINWEKRKNLTMKTIRRTQKNRIDGSIRNIVKQVPINSFFNFFNPPEPIAGKEVYNYDEDEVDATNKILQTDYNIGCILRFKVIPKAVLYFTGDFIENEEDDDDDYEEEEEDSLDEKENDDADAEQPLMDQQNNEQSTNECTNQ